MPLLTIDHRTEYHYARPVGFGEHRVMLRPRDGHDLRVLQGGLSISPQPSSLRWIHDVFGNSVAIASFAEKADQLTFVSTATVEHQPGEAFTLSPRNQAYVYPFPTTTTNSPISKPSFATSTAIRTANCRPGRAASSLPPGRRRPSTFCPA